MALPAGLYKVTYISRYAVGVNKHDTQLLWQADNTCFLLMGSKIILVWLQDVRNADSLLENNDCFNESCPLLSAAKRTSLIDTQTIPKTSYRSSRENPAGACDTDISEEESKSSGEDAFATMRPEGRSSIYSQALHDATLRYLTSARSAI
ncbi:hypothetical protein F5Y07DRAFT_404397 [Xylaria sp. FL0933]|nr:hypothetical protein F5Y07DRAFT_404397 [Xylaria sp. FL0933]